MLCGRAPRHLTINLFFLSHRYDVDVETMRRGLSLLFIQGQAKVKDDGTLEPDFEAYNLRQDEAASRLVFDKLQGAVRFELLVGLPHKHTPPQTPAFMRHSLTLGCAQPPILYE